MDSSLSAINGAKLLKPHLTMLANQSIDQKKIPSELEEAFVSTLSTQGE